MIIKNYLNSSNSNSFVKKIISITLDASTIKWLEKQLKSSVNYRNRSHLIEIALESLKNKEK